MVYLKMLLQHRGCILPCKGHLRGRWGQRLQLAFRACLGTFLLFEPWLAHLQGCEKTIRRSLRRSEISIRVRAPVPVYTLKMYNHSRLRLQCHVKSYNSVLPAESPSGLIREYYDLPPVQLIKVPSLELESEWHEPVQHKTAQLESR